jgi:hypothetical protein
VGGRGGRLEGEWRLYEVLRPLVFHAARRAAPATASLLFKLTSEQDLLIARSCAQAAI